MANIRSVFTSGSWHLGWNALTRSIFKTHVRLPGKAAVYEQTPQDQQSLVTAAQAESGLGVSSSTAENFLQREGSVKQRNVQLSKIENSSNIADPLLP